MSDENIKVSELPEKEQKELLAEAFAVGLNKGVLTGYKVSTLKKKIAEMKEQKGENEQESSNEQNASNDEQNVPNDEQKAEENEQNGSNDEQKEEATEENGDEQVEEQTEEKQEENKEELPEGLSDEAKDFLEGKTDELPSDAEEIEEAIAGEKLPQKEEVKKPINGICHICGSRVENGVCTGCRFIR